MKVSLFLFALLFCHQLWPQTDPDFEHYQIDIHGKRTNLFDIIEHVEIIPLEETENSLLKLADNYFKTPLGFAIPQTKKIFLFHGNGEFHRVIDNSGNGPNEYANISSSWYKDGHIELFSGLSRKLQKYTLNGELKETITAKYSKNIIGGSMHPFENGYVFQPLDPSPNNKAELSLVFTDLELNQIGDIGLKSPPHPFPLNLGKRFTLLNTGELIYRRVLSEGAFLVDLNHLTPYLNFDYGNDWIWKNPKNTSSIKVASKAIFGEKGFFEVIPNFSESFITFTFYHSNRTTTKGILDRSTKEYFNLRVRKSDRSDLEMNFIKWENHRLVASMHTSELENILSNLNPNQYIIRGNLTPSDFKYSENPVLLKIKFK